jgi:hypothetical protein
MAKAAAQGPNYRGGWGQGSDIRPADLLLIRKAIRERWDVPEATCDAIAARLHEILACDYSAVDARMWVAVCRVIITMVGDNYRRAKESQRPRRHKSFRKPTADVKRAKLKQVFRSRKG